MAISRDPLSELVRQALGQQAVGQQKGHLIAADIRRAGEHYVVQMDMPGVDPDSIDIDVEDRTITVRAERRTTVEASSEQDHEWISRERAVGTFARQLSVGSGLALDKMSADYTDGVLTLTIPVAEEAKPRKISVSHGERRTVSGSSQDKD